MPKVRRGRKRPPDGWDLIEETLESMEQKMREGKVVKFVVAVNVYTRTSLFLYFQLKRNHMKESASMNHFGLFLRFTIRNPAIFTTCSTDERSFLENCTSIA